MGNPALEPEEHFTYRQYLTWPDEERWELIDGVAWCMSPGPRRRHQALLTRLIQPLATLLKGKSCQVFAAPFDVIFPAGDEADEDVDTVVQPDLAVFCDPSKLTERGARGAPDLVIEILSPSTSRKDQNEKLALYERSGVREYWVVDPAGKWICVYRPKAEAAAPLSFDGGELREAGRDYSPITSRVLAGLVIDPEELFRDLD